MRMFVALLFVVTAVSSFGQDWVLIDEWPVPEVLSNPDDETDTFAFGLAWKDDLIYVQSWNPDTIWPEPPWYTNLYVYDESGNYQGTQFSSDLDQIDCSCVDWKGDSDHGGEGWYMGARMVSTMYFTAEDGSSYDEFAGPSNFSRMYGVAHNPDNDMLYVSDDSTGWAGWGYLDGSGHVTSWVQENVGFMYCSMKYVPVGRSNYLIAVYREFGVYEYSQLHIFTLNSNGEPRNIYSPDIIIDFGDFFYYPGDFSYDGEYMWLLDQNKDGAGGLDYVAQIDLPGFDDGIVNIKPASLGQIKAQFR
jgi:hypothetical protein